MADQKKQVPQSNNSQEYAGESDVESIHQETRLDLSSLMQEVEIAIKTQGEIDTYSEQKSEMISRTTDAELVLDPKDVSSEKLASPIFLSSLVENFSDRDWFSGDSEKEKKLLKASSMAIQARLKKTGDLLSKAEEADMETNYFKKLQESYIRDCKLYTEVIGNVSDALENPAIRDPAQVAYFAGEALGYMDLDSGIAWVKKTMKRMDANNWQSKGLTETYGVFANKCRESLAMKMKDERKKLLAADPPNPKDIEQSYETAIDLATLFTDRGGDIDSGLCNPDWAAGLLRDALNFNDIALQYVDNNIKTLNNEETPLLQTLDEKRQFVLEKIKELPEDQRNNPDFQKTFQIVNKNPNSNKSFTEISTQYSIIRRLEATFNGEQLTEEQLTQSITSELAGFANKTLDDFLSTGANGMNVETFSQKFGVSFSSTQKKAYELMADIEGYGWADFSDSTNAMIVEGTKMAGMIAAGIAIGIVTGGAGFGVIGAALAGGVGMTASTALIYKKGFDDSEEALKIYGTDFAVNTATFGAARYLQAGRAALQLRNAGMLKQAGGLKNIINMGVRGGGGWKQFMTLEEAFTIGNRLKGGLAEGTAFYVVGSVLEGTSLTIQEGGTFLQNFKNALTNPLNVGFIGVGIGLEMSPALWKQIRGSMKNMDNKTLQGLSTSLNSAKTIKSKVIPNLKKSGVNWKQFAESNWADLKVKLKDDPNLKKMHGDLRKAQKDFEMGFISLSPKVFAKKNADYEQLKSRGWNNEMIANAQTINNGNFGKVFRELQNQGVLKKNLSAQEQKLVKELITKAHNLPLDDISGKARMLAKTELLSEKGRRYLMEKGYCGKHFSISEAKDVDNLGFKAFFQKDIYDNIDNISDPTKSSPYYANGFVVKDIIEKNNGGKIFKKYVDQFGNNYAEITRKVEVQKFVSMISSTFSNVAPVISIKNTNGEPVYLSKMLNLNKIGESPSMRQEVDIDLMLFDFLFKDGDHVSNLDGKFIDHNIQTQKDSYYVFDFDGAFSDKNKNYKELSDQDREWIESIQLTQKEDIDPETYKAITLFKEKIEKLQTFMKDDAENFFMKVVNRSGLENSSFFKDMNLSL